MKVAALESKKVKPGPLTILEIEAPILPDPRGPDLSQAFVVAIGRGRPYTAPPMAIDHIEAVATGTRGSSESQSFLE